MGSSDWVPPTHVGDPDAILSSQFQPMAAMREVMVRRVLCLCLSLLPGGVGEGTESTNVIHSPQFPKPEHVTMVR